MSIAELVPMSGGSEWPLASRLEPFPGGAVLHVMGELDLLTAPALREQLKQALEAHEKIVVDCSNLDYIDVTGIRALEETGQKYNARLALIGSKPIVRKIFDILQLQSVIPIFPNREAALNFLKGN
jgi:anti-sigma B factor antagonist